MKLNEIGPRVGCASLMQELQPAETSDASNIYEGFTGFSLKFDNELLRDDVSKYPLQAVVFVALLANKPM